MKPFYDKNGITIFCGECSEVMGEVIEDNSIDLTVTSPPYDDLRLYKGYTFDFEAISKQLYRVTTQGGVVVWVVADATKNGSETGTSFRQALGFMGLGFNLHDTMIYFKNGMSFPETNRYYPVFEYMFVFSKDKPKTVNLIKDRKTEWSGSTKTSRMERQPNGKIRRPKRNFNVVEYSARYNVWSIDAGFMKTTKDKDAYAHPAIFPEALARDHIISWSNPGDIVLDPMCGSGTTLKMAQNLGRKGIGIEISEEYCKIAVERLRQPSFFSLPSMKEEAKAEQLNLLGE